jgi:hypothetical protein
MPTTEPKRTISPVWKRLELGKSLACPPTSQAIKWLKAQPILSASAVASFCHKSEEAEPFEEFASSTEKALVLGVPIDQKEASLFNGAFLCPEEALAAKTLFQLSGGVAGYWPCLPATYYCT